MGSFNHPQALTISATIFGCVDLIAKKGFNHPQALTISATATTTSQHFCTT